MIKGHVIFDFDGTLSNLDHRLHHVAGPAKNWDAFFDAVGGDSPNDWCVQLMHAMSLSGYIIVIVSGRTERTRAASVEWLKKHHVTYDDLVLVRKDGDHAPDDLLKENWLKAYSHANDIEFVVDDRQRFVDMWRRNGLVCLQCAQWEEK